MVRLHFQEKPWDLYVAVGYTVVVAAVLLALNVGNLLAILLVLFVPGYVLVAALFPSSLAPEKSEIDWIERIALSFGLSIAIVPLLGLLLNFTPFGIRFAPIVATIAAFTVGVGYAAAWRRMRLPQDRRLSLEVKLSLPNWNEYGSLEKIATVALSASIAVAGGALYYILLMPRPEQQFTQFYLLGPTGEATGYPTQLNVSQPGSVTVGIKNHESAAVSYTVRVDLVGIRFFYNSTVGFNQTMEVNRTDLSWLNMTLLDGQTWTQPYTFRINAAGLWKVQFLLYKLANFLDSYGELHLFVRVA